MGKREQSIMNQKLFINQKDRLLKIPRVSGIYYFYDKAENLLYIGKARTLRSRIWEHYVHWTHRKCAAQVIDRIFDKVYWIEIQETTYSYVHFLEIYLINKLRPLLNSDTGCDVYYNFRDAELVRLGVMDPDGLNEIDSYLERQKIKKK